LADDATSADQVALSVCESLSLKVVTLDARSLSQRRLPEDEAAVWIINSGTRALSSEEAYLRGQQLAVGMFSKGTNLPLVQIDSRLRGVRNALRGLYESLDFAVLLFVPAEPALGRLVQNGIYYHLDDTRPTPFHQSRLASSAERPLKTSDLREIVADELGIACEKVFSLDDQVMSRGPDAFADLIRGFERQGKSVVIPDVYNLEHFETVNAALKKLVSEKVLVAGSRTYLRSFLASFAGDRMGTMQTTSLAQTIDRRRKGAPLAIICSRESATNLQVEYAQRGLGPNLITVGFDSGVILAEERKIQCEVERAQQLVLRSLKAMRPVLVLPSGLESGAPPAVQQRHLTAISEVIASHPLLRHVTSLFVSGGQTAETVRNILGVSAVEIKGAFQESIPWGLPLEGPLKRTPLVTKGGRMGSQDVLFHFFEQGHPLPRANILPVVTPLTASGDIDEAGIERLILHLARLGTTDVFPVGNAGEFRFLENASRLKALEIFARQAKGTLRVFAGVTGDSAEETMRNYEAASGLGVFAAVVMPLFFLTNSEKIVPFVKSLAAIQSGLPLVLYNNPGRTRGQNISFEAVEAVGFPVIALKDSSGDLERLDQYLSALPVYQGQQRQFLEGYLHGARGTVGIIGHVSSLPNEFFAPGTSASRREEIARSINELSQRLKQGGAEVAAYKFLLSLMGVMGETVASNEPIRCLTAAQKELIRANNSDLISCCSGAQAAVLSPQQRPT